MVIFGNIRLNVAVYSTALWAEWGRDITGNFKEKIATCNKMLRRLKGKRDEEAINEV